MNIKELIILSSITGLSLLSPISSKAQKDKEDIGKDLTEVLYEEKNDNKVIDINNHESIINSKYSDIISYFWKEKWIKIIRKHMLIEINKIRNEKNPLVINNELNICAQNYADTLSKNKLVTHGYNWISLDARIWKTNYWAQYAAENLHNLHKTITISIKWFYNSPGHKKNMQNIIYKDIWIGISFSDTWVPYIVQVFWKKRDY